MWFLNGSETLRIHRLFDDWRTRVGFEREFHFQSISEAKLPLYLEVIEMLANNCATVGFKAVSVQRRGISKVRDALLDLSFHLLTRGLEHEHTTGRAPLPRGIQVCKDAEEPGQDRLFAAALASRMKQSATTRFEGKLIVEEFSAEESVHNLFLQLTDLFTSSVGRQLNVSGERRQPKDVFAEKLLSRLGTSVLTQPSELIGDMAVHIVL
jgi:hypothetical protein